MNYDVITRILEEDSELITYRKSLREIAGSVTATILLQQIMYRCKGREKFYKFKIPCAHKLYKEGDSWEEELGFSVKEFDAALRKIGTKITKGVSKFEALKKTDPTGVVIYWTDASRITWYQLNRDLLGKLLKGIYLVSDQRAFTYKNTKGHLPITETTTETTTKTKERAAKKPAAPAPLTQPTKKKSIPPAIEAYHDQFKRYPAKEVWADIEREIGAEAEALGLWRKTLKAWHLAGHNPTNFIGIFDWFSDGIPEYAKRKNGRGTNSRAKEHGGSQLWPMPKERAVPDQLIKRIPEAADITSEETES